MTEEMRNARKGAPQAILMSVYLGAVTGFIFLIAVCFCIGDINNTALSNTGVPIIQIFSDSTNSVIGSCVLTTMILVITLVAANGLLAEGSRSIYAFSRDHGLPFSHVFSKVSTKHQIPIPAILLTAAVQISLNSIYFGSYTGFLTVISIATEGFCKCFFGISSCVSYHQLSSTNTPLPQTSPTPCPSSPASSATSVPMPPSLPPWPARTPSADGACPLTPSASSS